MYCLAESKLLAVLTVDVRDLVSPAMRNNSNDTNNSNTNNNTKNSSRPVHA